MFMSTTVESEKKNNLFDEKTTTILRVLGIRTERGPLFKLLSLSSPSHRKIDVMKDLLELYYNTTIPLVVIGAGNRCQWSELHRLQ
jgi:hypothetical protein